MLLAPAWWWVAIPLLVAGELSVPVWAERAARTPWHRVHISERYGLLTLIVLGESVLAAATATEAALASGEAGLALVPLIAGGLSIVFSMWWVYFARPSHHLLTGLRQAIVWGYGHYFVFASAAAVGAGLAVAMDQATHHAQIGVSGAGAAVAVPVAVYVVSLWFLLDRPERGRARAIGPIAAALILLTPLTGHAVAWVGGVLVAMMVVKAALWRRAPAPSG